MKSFDDAMVEIFPHPRKPTWSDLKDIYNAGATEARKSMRCESCRFYINGICDDFGYMFRKRPPKDFGCIHHQERKENG